MKFPKGRFNLFSTPILLNDIDRQESFITIGNKFNQYDELIKNPDNIKLLCEIIPHSDFANVKMSFKYRTAPDNAILKSFDIYNNLENFVSSVEVIIKGGMVSNLPIGQVIYKRDFKTQIKDRNLRPFEVLDRSRIITTTAAFCYGAKYAPSLAMKNIQPYLFYLRNEYNPELNIISARDFLNQTAIKLSKEINMSDLASLEDDITSGKLIFNLPTGEEYKSFASEKTTLTNNLVMICFKK